MKATKDCNTKRDNLKILSILIGIRLTVQERYQVKTEECP